MRKKWLIGFLVLIFLLIFFVYSYLTGFQYKIPVKPIFQLRLLRLIVTFLAGYVLSVAGASLQTILQNPLADPYIVGVSSGALLGVALSLLFSINLSLAVSLPAFAFSVGTIFLIYYLSRIKGALVKELLILGGLFLNFFFNGLVFLILVLKREVLSEILYKLWGYTGIVATQEELLLILLTLILAFILSNLTLLKYKELDAITLGDAEALSLGVDVHKVRNFIFLISSATTALVVSVTGAIGFVGLMVPNIVKRLIGGKHSVLIPASGLGGALLLLIADSISKSLFPVEMPLSIILGIFSVPFFFWILWRQRNESDRS